jgi:hypothetical protein
VTDLLILRVGKVVLHCFLQFDFPRLIGIVFDQQRTGVQIDDFLKSENSEPDIQNTSARIANNLALKQNVPDNKQIG